MSTKLLLALCIVSFVVAALRFMPTPPVSTGVTDFAGGAGVGFGIGLLVIWLSQRTPRD